MFVAFTNMHVLQSLYANCFLLSIRGAKQSHIHKHAQPLDLKDSWKKLNSMKAIKNSSDLHTRQAFYKERSPSVRPWCHSNLHPFKVPLLLFISYLIFLNSSSFLFVFTLYFSFLKRPPPEH